MIINQIAKGGGASTADATAAAGDILTGHNAYLAAGKTDGTMPNIGAQTATISTKAGTVTPSAGYHNGSGSIAISATEQAKIIAGNIKSGVTMLGVGGSMVAQDNTLLFALIDKSVMTLTIPDGAVKIDVNAFMNMTHLVKAWIPASVTAVIAQTPTNSPFFGCGLTAIIYCEAASKPVGWGNYWYYSSATEVLAFYFGKTKAQYDAL